MNGFHSSARAVDETKVSSSSARMRRDYRANRPALQRGAAARLARRRGGAWRLGRRRLGGLGRRDAGLEQLAKLLELLVAAPHPVVLLTGALGHEHGLLVERDRLEQERAHLLLHLILVDLARLTLQL